MEQWALSVDIGFPREMRYEYPIAFLPNLDTLRVSQRALWPELEGTPETFTLYGGTALALRLGHRASADFDFFRTPHLIPINWRKEFPISEMPNACR